MTNNETLYNFFETDYPLNQDGVKELVESFKDIRLNKGDLIVQEGDAEKKLRFLISGVVREYYSSEEKDTNINFYTYPQFITDFSSFNNGIPTRKNQECLTKVELKELEKTTFSKLLEKYPCGKGFLDLTFQKLLQQKEEFEYNRLTKEPEALYKVILKERAGWLNDVPQYHIASFLGITPETLSRIRKRIL